LEFISTSDIVHDVRWRNEEPRGHWSRDAQDQLHESTALSATLAHRALRNKKRSFVARRAVRENKNRSRSFDCWFLLSPPC